MGIAESGALRGKVAIITGAATGIGRASALLFAQARQFIPGLPAVRRFEQRSILDASVDRIRVGQ